MDVGLEPSFGSPVAEERLAHRRPPRTFVAFATAAGFACALFLIGFGAFLISLDRKERYPAVPADAIVALTGGQGRIEDALDLLAKGYGRRLLITGVNERTSREAIARLTPSMRELVGCCVDLDYRARNTVGNAAEIRRWAEARGFRSLIVVTSNYHLPRTFAELEQVLPAVVKIPFAVIGGRPDDDWETRFGRARVIFAEYTKFLAVSVRTRMTGWLSSSWQAAVARRGVTLADRPRAG